MRLFVRFFVLFTILPLLTGCVEDGEISGDMETDAGNGVIQICLLSNDDAIKGRMISGTVQRMVQQFNRQRNSEEVIITYVGSEERFRSCMTDEIASGKGPDVIVLEERFFDCYKILDGADLLEDMSPYINGEKRGLPLDIEGIIPDLAKRYTGSNGRTAIALTMRAEGFLVSGKALEAGGFSMHNRLVDELDLLRLLQDYGDKTQSKLPFFETGEGVGAFSALAGTRWIDPESGTAYFDSPSFRAFTGKYLELLRSFPDFACPDFGDMYDSPETALCDGNVCMRAGPLNLTTFAPGAFSFCVAEAEDGGMTVTPDSCITINRNSTDKDLAYDFVRYCLTDGQRLIDTRIPANRNEIKKTIEIHTLGAALDGAETRFIEALMKTEKVYIPDGAIPNLMEEMLADIVQNGVSVDDAISELQRKTMEYFNK